MPSDDLLRFIGAPLPFSPWWLVLGLLVVLAVAGWLAGVFVWTLPPARLRRLPVIRAVHAAVNRRRFVRAVRAACRRYHDGGSNAAQAGAEISRTIRRFLYVKTGVRAQYLHVEDISAGELAAAAPLLDELNTARFDPHGAPDIDRLGSSAEELIASWT